MQGHKAELRYLLDWNEDEAYRLIKDVLSELCGQHQSTNKPDFRPFPQNKTGYPWVDRPI